MKNPLYVDYHDREWGRPVRRDQRHFEMLILEGAQAGLSWETILNKRQAYRKAYLQFNPCKVARFNTRKIESLMGNAGIVRNRLKIESSISNAKVFLAIQKEFGTFNKYVWQFVGGKPIKNKLKSLKDYPVTTAESDALAKDLKKRGFRFVGSTIIYAYMQAVGLVDDHAMQCFVRKNR